MVEPKSHLSIYFTCLLQFCFSTRSPSSGGRGSVSREDLKHRSDHDDDDDDDNDDDTCKQLLSGTCGCSRFRLYDNNGPYGSRQIIITTRVAKHEADLVPISAVVAAPIMTQLPFVFKKKPRPRPSASHEARRPWPPKASRHASAKQPPRAPPLNFVHSSWHRLSTFAARKGLKEDFKQKKYAVL